MLMKFLRRNFPIAKRRLTAMTGAEPIWWAVASLCLMLATILHIVCQQDLFRVLNDTWAILKVMRFDKNCFTSDN